MNTQASREIVIRILIKRGGVKVRPETSGDESPTLLQAFLRDCCVTEGRSDSAAAIWVAVADLGSAWKWYLRKKALAGVDGAEPASPARLARLLRRAGFGYSRSRRIDGVQVRTWEGLALKPGISFAMKPSARRIA